MKSPGRKFFPMKTGDFDPNDIEDIEDGIEGEGQMSRHRNPCLCFFRLSRSAQISACFSLILLSIVTGFAVFMVTRDEKSDPYTSGVYKPTTDRFQDIYETLLETINKDEVEETLEEEETTSDNSEFDNVDILVDIENTITGGGNVETSTNTPSAESEPEQELESEPPAVVVDPEEFVESIEKKETAQAKALNWIANYDKAKLRSDHPYLKVRYSLATFFFATSDEGANWKRKDNWLSGMGYCDWYGIECDEGEYGDGNGKVRVLNLTDNGLSGTIVPEVGFLTQLSKFSNLKIVKENIIII